MQALTAFVAIGALVAIGLGLIRPSLVLPKRLKPSRLKAIMAYTMLFIVAVASFPLTPEQQAERDRLTAERQAEKEARAAVDKAEAERKAAEAETRAAADKAEAERKVAEARERDAAEAREELARMPVRKIINSHRYIEKAEIVIPHVNIWLKPIDVFRSKDWLFMMSMSFNDILPAARNMMPDVQNVRIIAQASFVDKYGNSERGIATQLVFKSADLKRINFDNINGPPLLNFADIEKLRPGLREEVAAFCGDSDYRRQAGEFCQKAIARFR